MRLPAGLLLLIFAAPFFRDVTCPALAQDGTGGKKDGGAKAGGGDAGKPPERRRLVEGDEVKDLTLELVEGGSWTVAAARGKVVVLVFAGDWSAESLEALKRLANPRGKVLAAGAGALGILRDCGAEKARKTARDQGLTGALAVDPKRKAYDLLARSGLPYTVVIDRAGKIALSAGGFDEDAVAKKVEALLKP